VILHLDNFPPTLADKQSVLAECLRAFDQVHPIQRVLLFGSHARGTPHRDSDVDLCIVTDSFESQQQAAVDFRRAISYIRGKPPLSLIPITTLRLQEKQAIHDPFFQTVLEEGIPLAEKD